MFYGGVFKGVIKDTWEPRRYGHTLCSNFVMLNIHVISDPTPLSKAEKQKIQQRTRKLWIISAFELVSPG